MFDWPWHAPSRNPARQLLRCAAAPARAPGLEAGSKPVPSTASQRNEDQQPQQNARSVRRHRNLNALLPLAQQLQQPRLAGGLGRGALAR